MFSTIQGLTRKTDSKKLLDISKIQDSLTQGLFRTLQEAFESRKKDKNNSNFSEKDIDNIVAAYAKKNMIIAAASSIVPGPFGILSAVPELLLNFKNQMFMIYDLGCAYGKENFINKDLLLEIPLAAFGGNTDLAALQNTSNLLDSSDEFLFEKAKALAKAVMEKSLKKSVVQFVPIAGPIIMGTWAKMTTFKISTSSNQFLDSNEEYVEHFKKEETEAINLELQIQKIKALANLIESNNDINEAQLDFILPVINNTAISQVEKDYFFSKAKTTNCKFELDYQILKDYEEDESLIMELVVLAQRSGSVDELERQYIQEQAQAMDIDSAFVEGLFE